MNQEERILEFDKIKRLWMEYAFTEKAKEKIKETEPFLAERELKAKLRETTESRQLLEKCGNPPLVSLEGMDDILMAVSKGDCLTAHQLEQVRGALVAVRRLIDYLEKGKAYDNSLAYYVENLDDIAGLKSEIDEAIYSGEVADGASVRLRDVRRDILKSEDKMREKAEQIGRSNKDCMSDSFCTSRNGHICVPVKKEYKFKIPGTVIDKSATGNTIFIEPTASAKYYEKLQQLLVEEEDEVKRILYTLTVEVESFSEVLQQNIRTIEKLDFAFSKGKLSLHYEGTEPEIIQERAIHLSDARHPLLEKSVCVPLQFDIGEDIQGIVITGPNTGGKTVAIKTVALCCMMAQCGLHIPCKEAQICMCSNFLCDIGDGQNLSENLSTFSSHITNVLDILKRVNRESLLIMDELGSGTDPQEGMGIAIAILEELKKSGSLFLVTTHYPEIKIYAEKEKGIMNAKMAMDAENLRPLYQMVIGEAGESCALQIAKRLGMPAYMLRRAMKAAYDEELPEFLEDAPEELEKSNGIRIDKYKPVKMKKEISFHRGDSVMISPDKKIGIVCQEANDKGILRVQLQGKKIWINCKRVKLLVPAEKLYPEDYDFSIIFDTVENRKLRHHMSRKNMGDAAIYYED
ncbi:MAG: DNA mismatch repair protein MutS [Clostridia bacterium]|nr:DNA mismatch repair protein MutS [Lachnospiraceae bacterium]NCB99107.1 DNA mismatch repair protein MutS [Clostridia bacterium]